MKPQWAEAGLMALASEKLRIYRDSARRRWQSEQEDLDLFYEKVRGVGREAARILKREYGAKRVAVFGSAAHRHRFHSRSDLDLAVWGLDEKQYYRAVSRLLQIDQSLSVDLIRVEDADPSLLALIDKESIAP